MTGWGSVRLQVLKEAWAMTPLMSDLAVTAGGIAPLVVLVVLYLRRECQLTAARKGDPAQ